LIAHGQTTIPDAIENRTRDGGSGRGRGRRIVLWSGALPGVVARSCGPPGRSLRRPCVAGCRGRRRRDRRRGARGARPDRDRGQAWAVGPHPRPGSRRNGDGVARPAALARRRRAGAGGGAGGTPAPAHGARRFRNALGPGGVTTGMNDVQIAQIVATDLSQVPGAIGLNNHEGSKATADERVMRAVLQAVKSKGLIFVDSVTAPKSVGARLATDMQIRTASRAVFLDNQNQEDAIRAQIKRLILLALERKEVV